jgi:hypothetical protein
MNVEERGPNPLEDRGIIVKKLILAIPLAGLLVMAAGLVLPRKSGPPL